MHLQAKGHQGLAASTGRILLCSCQKDPDAAHTSPRHKNWAVHVVTPALGNWTQFDFLLLRSVRLLRLLWEDKDMTVFCFRQGEGSYPSRGHFSRPQILMPRWLCLCACCPVWFGPGDSVPVVRVCAPQKIRLYLSLNLAAPELRNLEHVTIRSLSFHFGLIRKTALLSWLLEWLVETAHEMLKMTADCGFNPTQGGLSYWHPVTWEVRCCGKSSCTQRGWERSRQNLPPAHSHLPLAWTKGCWFLVYPKLSCTL